MTYHEISDPICPVTGKGRPKRSPFMPWEIWTDHARKGLFNSCGACNTKGPPKTLHALNAERKALTEKHA